MRIQPIYLGTVFWGAKFTDEFMKFCLPSLLSPRNIPKLRQDAEPQKDTFLICTTSADWQTLKASNFFQRLNAFMRPVHVPIEIPVGDYNKMELMTVGHKMISSEVYNKKAIAGYVYPDTVYSDGVLENAIEKIWDGFSAVVTFCPRFANEKFLADVEKNYPPNALADHGIASRRLVQHLLPNIHSETLRHDFSRPFIGDFLVMAWWPVRKKRRTEGLVLHCLAWAPLFINYEKLKKHDTSSLEGLTIDCDYIHKNIPDISSVYACHDSDEMLVVSYTSEKDLTFFPLKKMPNQKFIFLGNTLKAMFMQMCIENRLRDREIDPLKVKLFESACLVHTNNIGPEWESVIRRAQKIKNKAMNKDYIIAGIMRELMYNDLTRYVMKILMKNCQEIVARFFKA